MTVQYHVITRHKLGHDEQKYPTTSKAVSNEIQRNLVAYEAHETWSFKVGTCSYELAKIKLQRVEANFVDENHPLLVEVSQKEGIVEFGSGPSMKRDDYRVMYLVSRGGNVTSQKDGRLIGGSFFVVGADRFRIRDFCLAPLLTVVEIEHTYGVRELNPPRPLSFSIHANRPDFNRFFTDRSFNVGFPGENIASLLRPQLVVLSPSCLLNCSKCKQWVITQCTVELYEIRSCMDLSKVDFLDTLVRGVRKRTLLTNECWEALKLNHRRFTFVLPTKLYQCVLPQLGPTFFSPSMSRQYTLDIILKVRCDGGHFKRKTSLMSDLNIAQEDDYLQHLNASFTQNKFERKSLLRLENFSKELFKPSDVGKSLFSELSNSKYDCYYRHETHSTVTPTSIQTMTWLEALVPVQPEVHILPRGFFKHFVHGNHYILRCATMVHSGECWAKWTWNVDGDFRTCPELWCCDSMIRANDTTCCNKYYVASSSKGFVLWPICLVASFMTSSIIQSLGSHIVLPGMKLLSVLKLQIDLPLDLLDDSGSGKPNSTTLVISYVCVDIEETLAVNHVAAPASTTTSRRICHHACSYTIDMAQVGKTKHDSRMGYVKLPSQLYEGEIPLLGPTFLTNVCHKTYNLKVELRLTLREHYMLFVVRLPIIIAIDQACFMGYKYPGRAKKRAWWHV